MQSDPPRLDYFALIKEAKKIDPGSARTRVRLALLADSAAQYFIPLLKVLFLKHGIGVDIYEAEYDTIKQEAYDPKSGLYAFKPDVIVILNATNALKLSYYGFKGSSAEFVDQSLEGAVSIWTAIKQHCAATIVQSNFVLPYERVFGNFEQQASDSFYSTTLALNQRLVEVAKSSGNVLINDVEYTASYLGRSRWFEEKLWVLCKAFCSLECLPYVVQNIVDIVRPLRGFAVKCVVLDLDNTLWGGVIGDDGLEGIRLGHLEEGEAYQAFQHYLLALKKRGILLAVCSRNDERNAILPFRQHPEMVLKETDIVHFVANWTNKAENIKTIQEKLNIGLDSMVFIDDDPFERNLVRHCLPEVIVPEMPAEPAAYVKTLSELNLFETASYSDTDKQRTEMYKAGAQRETAKKSFASTEDYLRSLNMRIELARFDAFHLPRIAQLIARSNQFNLTTKRYNEDECAAFMKDQKGYFPFYVTLRDDLGDSGMIGIVILALKGDTIEVDEWIMSCRVLLRGVEDYMMNAVFKFAKENSFKHVVGKYLPTPKNGMVRDFFGRYGFKKTEEAGDGASTWRAAVGDYSERTTFFIQEVAS